jgi:hypothetical protein
MAKTLDFLIEHEEIKGKSIPVNLEAVSSGIDSSSISIHHIDTRYIKEKRRGKIYYKPTEEKTIVYEFERRTPELKRISKYKGDFREKGFRWGEKLLKEYAAKNIKIKQKRRAHRFVKRVVQQLQEDYMAAATLKDKKNYAFFIKVLKKVNVDPDQKAKQLKLID